MKKATVYPTNLRSADDDGRVHSIQMSISEARDLIDEISADELTDALDQAQGDASIKEKPVYVVLVIGD